MYNTNTVIIMHVNGIPFTYGIKQEYECEIA